MYGIKYEDFYTDFSSDKEMLDLRNYSTKSKYDNSNILVVGKMKNETAGVVIKEFVALKPKMYSLVDDNIDHKKEKGVSKNIVATISHNEYRDVLLDKKCLRPSMNYIQSKDHRRRTYEISKVSLSCFGNKYRYETMDVVD